MNKIGSPRLGPPVIEARLGHSTGGGSFRENPRPGVLWESTTEYLLIPLQLTRPDDGVEATTITCPACDKQVVFRVASARAVQRQRIRRLIIALVLAAWALVVYVTGIGGNNEGLVPALIWYTGVGAGIAAIVLIYLSLHSEFRRAVLIPNKDLHIGDIVVSKRDHSELQGHRIFSPTGKLEDFTSLP